MLSAEKLKFLRQLHRITQTELGKEMGITKNFISMIENRKENYTEDWCKRYVNAVYTIAQRKQNDNNIEEVEEMKEEVKKITSK
ncbi:hypothetical protein GCM10008905_16560 [Clostridium malenominatum]|uniref:HTH cro/C1-type domain-containing protein n=1 Tax=Clostridium malenominatum TaxID=1539 RepID=A0ABP3U427_9CLOT